MKLLQVDPFDLVPNPWNSNKVSKTDMEKLKLSITKLGNFKPVLVRQNGTELQIIGGYHRTLAAKELGLENIPVLVLGEITDDKAKEISLLDNMRYGDDDKELLKEILDSLEDLETFEMMLPEEIELPDFEDSEDEYIEEYKPEEVKDVSCLKLYLENDKLDEIENILLNVAVINEYKDKDKYDLAMALYHILVLEK